jgi:threonine/homoserine/homoserine lactone efflux protein
MELFVNILKAFLVGFAASVPVGPVAILVVQKSLSKGHRAGFVTGLGASVVDTLFAVIAVFALAFTQKFLSDHEVVILLAGGAILIGLGLSMALKDPFRKMKADGTSSASATDFMQTALMTMSNPGAIFIMLALFAFFGIADNAPSTWHVAPILLSVAGGSVTYWFLLSWGLGHFRNKFKMTTILWISRVTGALVVIIGLVLLSQGLFKVIFHGMPIQ